MEGERDDMAWLAVASLSCILSVMATKQTKRADEMYALYQSGYSLAKVGEAFGVTRQTVYMMFTRRNLKLRGKPEPLPFVTFNGDRYTLRNTGYYGRTDGQRTLLHRDMYEHANGEIPDGYDIHHIDRDKTNNTLENFELISKSNHASQHNTGCNQFQHRCGK